MRSAVVLGLTAALLCAACGSGRPRPRRTHPKAAFLARPAAVPPRGPAFGLTEDDAQLLWSPASDAAAGASASEGSFAQARGELTALHPSYLRLVIDWATFQPSAGSPPALALPLSGCAREVGPCGPYAGVRDELAAIASQQRASAARGEEAFTAVIDIYGVPAWAAARASGCELPGVGSFARALAPGALASYRALIGALLALAEQEGARVAWWSPWNEPNDPLFLNPQHAGCSGTAAALSPLAYAQLARAMAQELHASGAGGEMLLGELAGYPTSTAHTTSIRQFIAGLPEDVLCLAGAWSVHAYARYGAREDGEEPVAALAAALDARGGCAAGAQIWVTEAGAGAPHAGRTRPAGAVPEREGCEALARQLARWYADPRVGAVFQYTFREDPDFRVGLASANLTHLYSTYALWLAYVQRRAGGEAPPPASAACAA